MEHALATPPISALAALATAGAALAAQGWLLGTAGNLSVRPDGGDVWWITASGGQKGALRVPDDFLAFRNGILPAAGVATRKPSAETAVHDALYSSLAPGSILHVHAPYMTLASRFTDTGEVPVGGYEFVKGLGRWEEGADAALPVVPNHHDIPTLAQAVAAAAAGAEVPCVLVAGHGAYAWGDTVDDARRHIECTEFLCRMAWEEFRAGLRPAVGQRPGATAPPST